MTTPEQVLADLTEEYLRPVLTAMGVDNPEDYSLGWEEET